MRPTRDRLFDWILSLGPTAKYNLTSSGLTEPALKAMGVETSYEKFAAGKTDLAFAEAFADEVARLYGVDPENVVVTAGASEAIFLTYSVFAPGRAVVVPLPNYPPMFTVPRALGMDVSHSVFRAKSCRALLGLTDPNNPTGRSLDADAVDRHIDQRGRTTIFVNETYREFTFPDRPETHFKESAGIVASNTMTKFYGLGRLRVGWILADRKIARLLLHAKWAVSGHDSEYSLWLATQALKKREAFVDRAWRISRGNVTLVRSFLEQTRGVSAELGAAPFCLVRYTRGRPSVEFGRRLLERTGVLVAPGDFFGAPKAFRLCFTASEETLKKGLEALSGFLNDPSAR
ncbi:MAG: pyridoxal phosphate-dependent aminotransferase [Nitrososphaerota archaeon]|nr:pyridoxal phosphate-dependent aminotransferase [Nitrososphaerota archaeon]